MEIFRIVRRQAEMRSEKLNRLISDIKKYRKYTIYAAKSELKSEVANSHLSWMWWILDPLLFMVVYSFVAVIVFQKGEPYLPVFIFIGYNHSLFYNLLLIYRLLLNYLFSFFTYSAFSTRRTVPLSLISALVKEITSQ